MGLRYVSLCAKRILLSLRTLQVGRQKKSCPWRDSFFGKRNLKFSGLHSPTHRCAGSHLFLADLSIIIEIHPPYVQKKRADH